LTRLTLLNLTWLSQALLLLHRLSKALLTGLRLHCLAWSDAPRSGLLRKGNARHRNECQH
jgi:hypothetical protein